MKAKPSNINGTPNTAPTKVKTSTIPAIIKHSPMMTVSSLPKSPKKNPIIPQNNTKGNNNKSSMAITSYSFYYILFLAK